MTQYQQVLNALKNLGGKGTYEDICKNIDFTGWGTKTPKNSVGRYLSIGDDFEKENDLWKIKDKASNTKDKSKNDNSKLIERGLYFITLNPSVKPPVAGLLFKIGSSDGNVYNRLKSYGSSLPYDPIIEIAFYPIPSDIDLKDAEDQVRGELLGNDKLGFQIQRYFGHHQLEWLQTLDLKLEQDDINKLAHKVNAIVKDTIENLRN
jgi:hypothetical protein